MPEFKSWPELSAAVATADILAETELDDLDSVYLGQPYCLKVSGNLLRNLDELSDSIKMIQLSGRRAYVTTPIIPESKDFDSVEAIVSRAAAFGADAVEIHDAGVLRWTRKNFPDLPVHLSSFLNIYQPETAIFYKDMGVTRIVPANELLESEVELIKEQVERIEFAVPVHGSLPLGMAYSCLLRRNLPGEEMDPCRQQCAEVHDLDMGDWKMRCVGTSLVSADDFSMIEFMPALISEGFDGFRLETHFDEAERISEIANIYRNALVEMASRGDYPANDLKRHLQEVCGDLSNGWRYGLSGKDYISSLDEDPFMAAKKGMGKS